MSVHTEHYGFREKLVSRLQRDLLGPTDGDQEIISDAPVTAYSAGVLFPRRKDGETVRTEQAEQDVDLAPAALAAEENPDTGVSLANVQTPSSMGLTFAVDPAMSTTVIATISTAVYDPIDREGNIVKAQRAEKRTTERERLRWRRRSVAIDPVSIDVTIPRSSVTRLVPGLELRLRVREPSKGAVAVTATLVNVHDIGRYDFQDAHCFFQSSLHIAGPEGI